MFKNKFKIKILFFVCLFLVFCSPSLASAAGVVINEIAWMGIEGNSYAEWIELYNDTNEKINLSGWIITTERGLNITLEGELYSYSYFLLLKNTTGNVPEVDPDQIYTGKSLINDPGEKLRLTDKEGMEIDVVDCSAGWFDGNKDTKQTMEKISIGWQTSLSPGGTPKSANSCGAEIPTEETPEEPADGEEPTDEISSSQPASQPAANHPPIADAGTDITALVGQEILFDGSLSYDPNNDTLSYFWNFGDGATDIEQSPKHTYLYPGQYIASLLVSDEEFSDLALITVNIYNQSVIISEFMPAPEGTDTENEWIELFNQSAQIANLTNWQLDDQEGGSLPFTFPANSLIAPNQFLVLIRPITKISLNNDNDQVRLFYPDGFLSAEVGYLAEKKQGFSVAFDGSDYFWTKTPTPGSANIVSSNNLNKKGESPSANNPDPVIQQVQNTPENTVAVNLNQSQQFSALSAPVENIESTENKKTVNPQPNQTASLSQSTQSTQSNQKSKLILIISIIISASLFVSWGLIMFSKKRHINI